MFFLVKKIKIEIRNNSVLSNNETDRVLVIHEIQLVKFTELDSVTKFRFLDLWNFPSMKNQNPSLFI